MLVQEAPVTAMVEQQAQVVLLAGGGEGAGPQGGGGRRHLGEHLPGQLRQILGGEDPPGLAVGIPTPARDRGRPYRAVGARQQGLRRLQQPARREPLGSTAQIAAGEQQRALAGGCGQGCKVMAVVVGQARRRRRRRTGDRGTLGLGEQRVLDRQAGEDPLCQTEDPHAIQIGPQRSVHRTDKQAVPGTPLPRPRVAQLGLEGTTEPGQIGLGVDAVQTAQPLQGGFDLPGCGALVGRPVVPPPGLPADQVSDRPLRPARQSPPRAHLRCGFDAFENPFHEAAQTLGQSDVALDLCLPPVAVLAEPADLHPAVGAVGVETPSPFLAVVQHPGAAADALPGRHRHRPPRALLTRVQQCADRRRGQPGHDVVPAESARGQAQQSQQEPSHGALGEWPHRRPAERQIGGQQLVVQQAGVGVAAAVQHSHPFERNALAQTLHDATQGRAHLLVRVGHGEDAVRRRRRHNRRLPGLGAGQATHDGGHRGVRFRGTADARNHHQPLGGPSQSTQQVERRGPQPLRQVQQHRPRPSPSRRSTPSTGRRRRRPHRPARCPIRICGLSRRARTERLRLAEHHRRGHVQQVSLVVEASVPQTPPHLPADRNHVGGARRRPLQCRQLAAAQISQRPVRLSKGTLGREMLSDLCEHPRGRGLQHPPHGACKDRGRNGPTPLRCQGVAREQFRQLTEREAVHTDHPPTRQRPARRDAQPMLSHHDRRRRQQVPPLDPRRLQRLAQGLERRRPVGRQPHRYSHIRNCRDPLRQPPRCETTSVGRVSGAGRLGHLSPGRGPLPIDRIPAAPVDQRRRGASGLPGDGAAR